MKIRRYSLEVTTNSSGVGSKDLRMPAPESGVLRRISGLIRCVSYIKDPTVPFTDGVDFTVLGTHTPYIWQESNVNASKCIFPHQAAHEQDGSSAVFNGGNNFYVPFIIINSSPVVFVENGGSAKKGTFHFYVDTDASPFGALT